MSTTYRVVVTREGADWLADIPQLAGTHTYARTLATLDSRVREAIALAEDLPEGAEADLDLDLDIRGDDSDVFRRALLLVADRELIEAERRRVTEETEIVARELVDRCRLSVRDAARLTGVSSARIGQVAPRGQRATTRRQRVS